MSQSASLQIAHANIYHLANKIHDVCMLLNQPSRIHILGLSETRLDASKGSEVVHIPQYSFLRKDGLTHGRTGLGIYIHTSISECIKRRPDLEPETVECMWVEYRRCSRSPPILIGFIYRNPAENFAWHDEFVSMMDSVTKYNNKLLLLGDFNYDLMKSQPAWESTVSLFGLSQLITSPTRVTPTTSTLLDHIYTNDPNMISDTCVSDTSFSDHSPVICSMTGRVSKVRNKGHTTFEYRSFKHFDKNEFLFDLDQISFDNVLQCDDATVALNIFYELLIPILNKHAPVRRKRVKQQTLPGWLTSEIIEAMRVRDNFKKGKNFAAYKKQRNKVTCLVRNAKRAYFSKMINNNSDTAAIWKAMNNITGKSTNVNKPPVEKISADAFNDHFLSIASSLIKSETSSIEPFQISPILNQLCTDKLKSYDSCTIPEMAVHEVGKYITELKNKKSTGLDTVNVLLLKTSLPYIVQPLTYIYNLCIKQSVFPQAFKTAKVIPLPKTTDLGNPNNFRPISLLSVLSKPLEKHIYKHLMNFMEHHSLFHTFQSGFRKNHSCHTALVHLCDKWLSAINKSEIAGAVFLDFKKAFDLVDHSILLQKLSLYVQNSNTLELVRSFLLDRTQLVCASGELSKVGTITCGVPQGSILGPLLFCIFINDLPAHITENNNNVFCDLFADDSTIHTQSADFETLQSSLQKASDNVQHWCERNRMVLHPDKTQCMVITSRQKHQREPLILNIKLQSTSLRQVREHKVLGVYIDQELKWQTHIEYLCKIVSRNLFLLKKLKLYVNPDARKLFFQAHCLSHISYASTVWCNAGEVHIKKINSLHRRGIKLISDSQIPTDEKFTELNILTLHKQFTYHVALLIFKILHSHAPFYLNDLLTKSHNQGRSIKLLLPLPRIDLFKTSLAFCGSKVWNSLPPYITNCNSINSFKVSSSSRMSN